MKNKNSKFKIVYGIFISIFLIAQALGCIAIYCYINEAGKFILLVYIIFNLMLGISFAYVLKFMLHKIFDEVNSIIEKAIKSDEIEELDEETETAVIVTKLTKYMYNQREKREHAVVSQKKYEKLISDISHQTKIPISNILIFSELLKENKEETDQYIDNIIGQAEKLKWLIQTLVNMSRLENGIIQYNIEKHSIQELLASALTGVYSDAEKNKIQINFKECQENIHGKFDLKWTTEALVNVIGNSIKYSSNSVQINIFIDVYQYYVRITVKDYGIGIRKEEIPLIYGRFYRGKNVRSYEGIGIGLYLTREILRNQGGYITISKEEQTGSKVMIYLPLA